MKPSSRSLALPHLVRWWWLRPAGGRQVLLMALPLIVSTASWSVMHFVDRMFLLWHSTTAMAAAMPAGMLLFALACLPLGVASYVNTFVAQYEGAGRSERVGRCVWQGVWIGLGVAPLFLLSVPVAHWLFAAVGHSGELLAAESAYYRVLAFGAGAMVISTALAAFFTGRGEMRVVMVVDSSASLLNGLLDYAWIFGHWGFPAWGIEGAAWATVVAQWGKVAVYALLVHRSVYRDKYQIVSGRVLDPNLLKRILRYGGPNGLQMVVEVAAFAILLLLVGRLGEEAMAATTLALNVNSLAFVPMLGILVDPGCRRDLPRPLPAGAMAIDARHRADVLRARCRRRRGGCPVCCARR